jgi:hypothetical protein
MRDAVEKLVVILSPRIETVTAATIGVGVNLTETDRFVSLDPSAS